MPVLKFWLVMHPFSALKMKTVCSFEMLVAAYKNTQLYNPVDKHGHFYWRENLKFCRL
jgi:hypothetical protein